MEKGQTGIWQREDFDYVYERGLWHHKYPAISVSLTPIYLPPLQSLSIYFHFHNLEAFKLFLDKVLCFFVLRKENNTS